MQVNSFGTVELIFKDKYKYSIRLLYKANLLAKDMIVPSAEYHIQRRGKPVAFVWNHTHSIKFHQNLSIR